ncbi:LysM peptidoglycan-binding domain-containing protein [Halalkalibacillus halophilus]|uniref:LysM peptidoglycan-binding domain-containing protein n=1 Tax=Halalkalibacillus halophilus TaxID=392827 RepID=UPI0003F767DC|nr:glycoside hydrolase family 18 protein [Halalkalibacillus halophilus]
MLIHVVAQGDSIYDISSQYQVPVDTIISVNQLEQPEDLVIGQTLVIPIETYTVQQGDSYYSIAQKLNIPYEELAAYNDLSLDVPLQVGQELQIPTVPKRAITTNAYIEPTGGEVSAVLTQSARARTPLLTYLAPFSYQVNRDGTLNGPPLGELPEIATANNASLMMVVTNLEEGSFSQDLGRIILTDETVQNTMLDEIIRVAQAIGYKDIHFDFEFLPPDTREAYNQFLRKAKARFQDQGLLLSTALAPKLSAEQVGAWYEAHDYAAHGEIADFVVLMTYEWGYSGGPPMAVSPIGPVREVVEYALSEMPADKILLGQNLYGYDWTLPFVEGGEFATAISPNQAIRIARDNQQAIEYDEEAQAPYFFYYDDEQQQHEVWFEDARSIQAKFDLIEELGLKGISYWKLGLAFPQNWALLGSRFDIEKL